MSKTIVVCAALAATDVLAAEFPDQYVLEYPPVNRVVPPVRSTFYEITRTVETVNGRTFRHPLNGGYGVKLGTPIGGRDVVHLGADLGWFRVGEPVFAVADGIVRISKPSLLASSGDDESEKPKPKLPPGSMLWGNLIVIEHRLKSGAYVTTIYGHLGKRLVKPGDLVRAGQQIGTIGKQSVKINGGYKPHLHFAVKPGRMFEIGTTIIKILHGDSIVPVTIKAINPERVELDFGPAVEQARGYRMRIGSKIYSVEEEGGKHFFPAEMLWSFEPESFAIIGYAATTEGWVDPIAFLRNPDIIESLTANDSITPEKPVKVKALEIIARPAADWNVPLWHNLPQGAESLDVGDFKGKIVAVLCFESSSVKLTNAALAEFRRLIDQYPDDQRVAFVAIQSALRGESRNTFARAKRLMIKHKLDIPLGHDVPRDGPATIIKEYGVLGTPWMIVIDEAGIARINVFMPNAEAAAALIERVKALREFKK